MEIKKVKTLLEGDTLEFADSIGTKCCIWIHLKELRLDLDTDFAQFSQEDIKALLPYLQAYAETGQLSTLQGGDLREAFKPENLIKISAEQNVKLYEQEKLLEKEKKEKAYCLRQLDQQVDRIADLEDLLKKWCATAEKNKSNSFLNEVQEKTIQILGEDEA